VDVALGDGEADQLTMRRGVGEARSHAREISPDE
jgi:hypothetical protein